MRQFIITNFLLIVLVLAVAFAFIMNATIFQKEPDLKAKPAETPPTVFTSYWFGRTAELNSYRLQQAKSGALHKGEATLIFQTENFLPAKQVTADRPEGAIPVLKTSFFKKFATGLYDYSLSTTVFTPVEKNGSRPVLFPNTLKASMAGQEWDGHYYQQINYRDNAYQVLGKSFLEKEVDDAYTLEKVRLEDELWNQIRINPDQLPTGETRLIAGLMTARLRHKPIQVLPVKATLANYEGVLFPGNYLKSYTLEYPTDDRTLIIIFERDFPHKIVGWEETYDTKDNLLTSRAVLQKTIQTDYWNHKAPADSSLRKALLH